MLDAQKNNNNESHILQNNLIGEDMSKNITLRKDGRYMINLQKFGIRKFKYARTKRQADIVLKELKKTIFQKQTIKYTLKEWSEFWIKTYKEPFIKLQNCNVIKQLFNEINKELGHIELSELNAIKIQEFYNKYKTSRKKEKIILYLNACLQKANDNNLISKNPCKFIVKDKKLKFEKKPFTIEEQEKILKAIKGTDIEYYILFYLLTGVRKNELNNNFIEDIDFENNRIKVINEKQHSNLTSYKYIDLNPNFIKLLIENKDKFNLYIDTVYKKFKKVLKDLNIEGGLHTLRHTFATNYYYLGIPEKLISSWLGHSTLNITQDIYIGLQNKNIKNDLIKLYNNLLFEF